METILSGLRKYGLGLTLSHQGLKQLTSKSPEVADAVIVNPYTRVCFRLGDDDARKLSDGFSYFEAKDLQNLGIGEAIARVGRADNDFNLRTFPLPENDEGAEERKQKVIQVTRATYGVRREEVEEALAKERELSYEKAPPTRKPTPTTTTEVVAPAQESPLEKPKPPSVTPPQSEKPILPPPQPPKKPIEVKPESVPTLGRGGPRHTYLQNIIKRMAQERGYHAVIEEPLENGGKIDVALKKDSHLIACEISVTTGSKQELGNVLKCLDAGYDPVFLLCEDSKKLGSLKKAIEKELTKKQRAKVRCALPDECIAYLDRIAAESAGTEQTVRGYKVKVKYQSIREDDQRARREAVSSVILKAMKRLKEE